jgi:amidase
MPSGPHFANHLGGITSEFAVCRSVRDTATLFRALRGDAKGPYADPAIDDNRRPSLRIGLLTDIGSCYPTNPERLQAVNRRGPQP